MSNEKKLRCAMMIIFHLNVNDIILVKKRNTKAFRYVKEMINMVDISYIYVVRIHKDFYKSRPT